MSVEARTVPCRIPNCLRRVLLGNDQWHLHTNRDGTFRFLVGHDFGEQSTLPDDVDEEIEEYW